MNYWAKYTYMSVRGHSTLICNVDISYMYCTPCHVLPYMYSYSVYLHSYNFEKFKHIQVEYWNAAQLDDLSDIAYNTHWSGLDQSVTFWAYFTKTLEWTERFSESLALWWCTADSFSKVTS